VLQLASGEDHCVDQFLDLWVPYLGFREHLTDEVDRPLDWQRVSFFRPFDHDSRTDNLGCRSDVQE